MFTFKSARNTLLRGSFAALLAAMTITCARSAEMNIRDVPLFLNDIPPPLNMLVLSRDHRLYYEAYNDASDLNGDGILDVGFKPAITYYGYFESDRCYTYDETSGIYSPSVKAGAANTCSGAWSGNWMNYVTMSRIDALRKVLYGGLRYIDSPTDTVLQRSYIPQDAHSWGKEYESFDRDKYYINQYTPLPMPAADTRHLFANTTLLGDPEVAALDNPAVAKVGPPKMRVLLNSGQRVWNWLSIERPVAGNQVVTGINGGGGEIRANVDPKDYIVRVRVCSASSYDTKSTNCKAYPNGTAKPTGLLQDYGENDSMYFGLISGSYGNPHGGGVLRKTMASIRSEILPDSGQFSYSLSPRGIINTIDSLRITDFGGNYEYGCGWMTANADDTGRCAMWGNPTAEMMYEGLRYFAGEPKATGAFGSGAEPLGLTTATWNADTNPYGPANKGGFPACSKPFETVVSDASPSFDSDQLPGTSFPEGFSGENLGGLDVSDLGLKIWKQDVGGPGNYFIGEVAGSDYKKGAPTVKEVSSFGTIRGLSPEAPTKEGSYYAASVAYHGHQTDLNAAGGAQRVQTFAVALASPLPKIDIQVGGGRRITLVPFAKSVAGLGIDATEGKYQPTDQIVDFYVDTLTPTSGRIRVNFEDVEQGADHDMDAIAVYQYAVNSDGTVTVNMTSEYAAGGIVQHMGYVISGTTADGTYLEVRDRDTDDGSDPHYYLDTHPGSASPDPNWNLGAKIGFNSTRTFSPGTTAAAKYLKDPLWYAAKWGGFKDDNDNNIPDVRSEWASRAPDTNLDPDPDNYFLVTNALKLKDQLSQAFNDILDKAGSASSASVSSGSISETTRIYQATFDARNWSGHLYAYKVGTGKGSTTEGVLGSTVEWDAANPAVMPAHNLRKIFTMLPPASADPDDGVIVGKDRAIPFSWSKLDAATRALELQVTGKDSTEIDANGTLVVNYLRGDRSEEVPVGSFRKRDSVLGDIVNSAPIFVGAPPWRYPDSLEPSAPYSVFVADYTGRHKVIYAGANDGMMHAFDADFGIEMFAYMPRGVFKNLHKLADPVYGHQFYADGTPSVVDAFVGTKWRTVLVAGLNKGGQSVYALDVTDPDTISESSVTDTVLWEFTDQADPDLGYTYSRPAVVKLQNGQWVAIFGNGYNNTAADGHASSTGNAVLYVVNIGTGKLLQKIDTKVGMSADVKKAQRPNGLSTPAVIDQNGDGLSDTAYAGDLFGNLWKFDLSATDPNNWKVALGGEPLFVATNDNTEASPLTGKQRQPITERPQVGRGPNGKGWVVLFGTGKFLEASDRSMASLQTQSFYGIFDNATGTPGDIVNSSASPARTMLLKQTILSETLVSWTDEKEKEHTTPARATSANALTLPKDRGWYIDLLAPGGVFQGEMQVTNPVLRNGRVIFTTLIPDSDICAYGGRSWLMDMDALSGSRLPYSPFDLNRDKEYNSEDYISDGSVAVPPTGRGSDAILTAPAFLQGDKSDYAVTTSSGSESDKNTIGIDRSNAGPAGRGRQSWRQLR